jgi:hypothetical protein
MFERAVEGRLGLLGKAAARQLALLEMIAQAIATEALAAAGVVGAIAEFEVFFFFAVHGALHRFLAARCHGRVFVWKGTAGVSIFF